MRSRTLVCLMFYVLAARSAAQESHVVEAGAMPSPSRSYVSPNLPLAFEMNRGQVSPQVKFLSRSQGYTAFLTAGGVVLSLRPAVTVPAGQGTAPNVSHSDAPNLNATLQFNLIGSAKNPSLVGEAPLPGVANYFIGKDRSKWRTHVLTYSRVRYKNVYPGIDLVYYGNHRQLEYDFALSPGADPAVIQLEIKGADGLELDQDDNLIVHASGGVLRFQAPRIYQELNGQHVPVEGGYSLSDSTHVAFHVGHYEASKSLIIDPVLIYSTYLGGSGDDRPTGIAVDSTGNVYVAGYTDSVDFPLATEAPPLAVGATHVFVTKLDPTASVVLYSDYLGGSGQDYGSALALNGANEVYVTGSTTSSDFPMVSPYQGTYPSFYNGFVTHISADGSSLLYSSYLGGNGSDSPSSIALDNYSNIFVAGNTTSTNFPLANAFQPTVSPNQGGLYGNYGFLTKFVPDGSALAYSTYFGGDQNVAYNCGGTPCWGSPFSAIQGLALDSSGNAYVTGNTNTYNFPVTSGTYNTVDSTPLNSMVGFVSKFSSLGNLDYSTYFYETSGLLTNINAIAVDGAGSLYITGDAYSDGTFPVTSTSICDPTVYGWNCSYAFVTKFDSAATKLLYSTFLGPSNYAIPAAIALDANNDAYILATTTSNSFGIVNGIEQCTSGSEILLAEIDPVAGSQLFATCLGGSADETAARMAIDNAGNTYVTGSTDSTDFPTTQGIFQSVWGGNQDTFIAKIGPADAPSVSLAPPTLQFSAQAAGTASQPQTVLLRNMGSAALSIASVTTSGDFAQSNDCANNVAAAGNCTFSVTFSPAAEGTRNGSVVIQDNAAGSPQLIMLSGIGSAPVVALAPTTLSFPSQLVGTSSNSQTVLLTNNGNADLLISAIQVTGDFSQVNNCPSTLTASSSCTINVIFLPSTTGTQNGGLTMTDNAQGSPQSVSLSGIGSTSATPSAVLAPTSLTFSAHPLASTTPAQAVILTNRGNGALNIGIIQSSGDFAQLNNCPSVLAASSSCVINVTFTPTVAGNRTGTLKVNDNSVGSPQSVNLSGLGSDFGISTSQNTSSVKAGSTAMYQLTVSPLGGAFSSAVTLGCSGAPAATTCSLSPSTVTLNGAPVSVTVSIATTAAAAQSIAPAGSRNAQFYACWIKFPGVGLLGMIVVRSKTRSRGLRNLTPAVFLFSALLLMSACAGGTGIAPIPGTGTTPGTYSLTVTGTSGSLQHSLPLTLTVR